MKDDRDQRWRDGLGINDSVWIRPDYRGGGYETKVVGCSKLYIIAGDKKFRRDTGLVTGGDRSCTQWLARIEKPCDINRAYVKWSSKKNELDETLQRIRFGDLSIDMMDRIIAILKEPEGK